MWVSELKPTSLKPSDLLFGAEQDVLEHTITQSEHLGEAAAFLNSASKTAGGIGGSTEILGYLTRGALQLATRQFEEAYRSFDGVLSKNPHNVIALLGKVSFIYIQCFDALKRAHLLLHNRPVYNTLEDSIVMLSEPSRLSFRSDLSVSPTPVLVSDSASGL